MEGGGGGAVWWKRSGFPPPNNSPHILVVCVSVAYHHKPVASVCTSEWCVHEVPDVYLLIVSAYITRKTGIFGLACFLVSP